MTTDLSILKSKDLPPLLREIPQPPQQLYMRGKLPGAELKWLAVVGSRALSSYGKQACEYLIEGLRGQPVVIVSGLAYGADACAHRVALRTGLPCVAVPGSGLDYSIMYPKVNVALAKEIIKAGGAHLSEYEPKEEARDFMFPARNRIMVGLTHATLVIEAKERSGSLITARLATEYNRELLVVPGSIFSPTSKGTHQFLKLGATAVAEPDDILKVLGLAIKTPAPASFTDCTPDEIRVLEILAEPRSREDVYEQLSLPIPEASIILTTLEIKGLITEELGALRRRV